MNSTTTTVLPLFGEDTEQEEAAPQLPRARLRMRAATARVVAYRDTQAQDGEQRALLVVDCPFCEHQHIHPAGLADKPRVCPRHSRCVGQPTGTYYFPAVHQ